MKKERERQRSTTKIVLITLGIVFGVFFLIVPLFLMLFNGSVLGNVALIPIEGIIVTTTGGDSLLGQSITSSEELVQFIEKADESETIKVIVLEINSPGGSAVASDEVAMAVKSVKKPVIALIREVGASGGYWIASASDYIVANRMSITGSIGVVSSYLEFSGLMEEYGVSYERLVAGKYKDIGTPLKDLESDERLILQSKLEKIHEFFIQEVAQNRKLSEGKVRALATGEFHLGVEALEYGLIDALGDKKTVESYIRSTYGLESVDFVVYERQLSFFEALSGVFNRFSFHLGRGVAASLESPKSLMLV